MATRNQIGRIARRKRHARKTARILKRRRKNPSSGIRIVHNKLLGGWFVVRGPHQSPLNGRFNSKADAQAWLANAANRRIYSIPRKSNPRGRRKNPVNTFNRSQLERLAHHYGKLETINPGGAGYAKLSAYMDQLPIAALKQLAGARVKFLSAMARNRVSRKENPRGRGRIPHKTKQGKNFKRSQAFRLIMQAKNRAGKWEQIDATEFDPQLYADPAESARMERRHFFDRARTYAHRNLTPVRVLRVNVTGRARR